MTRCKLILTITMVASVTIVVASCTKIVQQPSSEVELDSLCTEYPAFEQCSTVNFSGGVARYALLRSAEPTESTIWVDFGGPGISVLSGAYKLAQAHGLLQSLGINTNLLVIEEPWVTRDLEPACKKALSSVSPNMQTGRNEHLANTISPCLFNGSQHKWQFGFTPSGLEAVISAIKKQERIHINEVIGISFGSVRYAYLSDQMKDVTVTLINPYPVASSVADVFDQRAAIIERWITEAGANPNDFADIRMASAAFAASYGGKEKFSKFIEEHLDGTLSEQRLNDLYRSTWLIYGDSMVSPAYLAYLEELCKLGGVAGQDTMQHTSVEMSPIRQMLSLYHAPCASANETLELDIDNLKVDCLIANEGDPIVPLDLLQSSFKTSSMVSVDPSNTHTWVGGLTQCFAGRVQQPWPNSSLNFNRR